MMFDTIKSSKFMGIVGTSILLAVSCFYSVLIFLTRNKFSLGQFIILETLGILVVMYLIYRLRKNSFN